MTTYNDWLPKTTLGQRILDLRTSRGLSTRQLQDRCAVSASTISRVERGHDIHFSQLVKLATGFNLTVAELLDGVDVSEWEESYEV